MKPTNDSVINKIQSRDTLTELDTPPEQAEFTIAVTELKNDKAPGPNNVPPNAFKAMTQEKLFHLFEFIIEFWEDGIDFTEWHKGQVVPASKSRDLYKQNKCRGVNFMDIGAKVFSSMMCKILFKIIKLHR